MHTRGLSKLELKSTPTVNKYDIFKPLHYSNIKCIYSDFKTPQWGNNLSQNKRLNQVTNSHGSGKSKHGLVDW